jgi:galactonate dehydratase
MDDPIKSVETYLVDGGWRNFLFVRIETAGGVEGWGEATLGWKEFAVAQLVNELGAIHVVGKSPFDIERVWFTLFQSESNIGPVILSAMAGIEMAMWDIAGKLCGQPVVNLVGGAIQTRVRAYANGWYSEVEDPDALRAAAAGVVAKGYTALKFDPFGAGGRELDKAELRKARAIVAVVRDEVGPDVDIMIECHGRFSVGTALEVIRALVEYEPFWFEEPIPAKSVKSQAWVTEGATALGARIATGEHAYSRFEWQDMLRERACHIAQPDLVYSGGFMETKKIAAMAEAGYVGVAPHNCDGPGRLAASVHLCANMPNYVILETFEDFDVAWRRSLTIDGPRLVDGYYEVGDSPGWGYAIDRKVAAEHPGRPGARMDMFAADWEQLMCP